ncbi:MAG: helix-turn-helix domain-containing protein [Clostridiales bacterium]|nr:helix-turn-helix domain-containing protein [Clostridiales bacterium]
MITLPMLVNDLGPAVLSVSQNLELSREYRGIYLTDGSGAMEKDMIYVGSCDTVTQLLVRGDLTDGCAIFSAGDSERLRNAPARRVHLIVTSLSLIDLYNQLAQVFLRYEDWQTFLRDASGRGLKPLLLSAGRYFNVSVFMLSPNLLIQAQSLREEDEERMPGKSGLAPEDFQPLQQLLKKSEDDRDYAAKSSERRDGYIYGLAPVCSGGTVLGYLFACSNNRTSILKNMLTILPQIVGTLMLQEESADSRTGSFQMLATQFLGDQPDHVEELEERLRCLSKKPRRFMRGIVIRQIDEEGQILPVSRQSYWRLFREMEEFFPNDNVAMLDECIYVMTSDDKPDAPITIDRDPEFEALLKKHQAFAMVSNPSQRLQGVRVLFRQCFQILPAAVVVRLDEELDRHCLRYDRYSPYYIIYLCEHSREMGTNDILYLCHPAVLTLTRYDRAYNNNLRDTLFSYLMNDRSISKISREMFMHRNTVIYKINKIQELINDDLSNPYTRHQLILSCMIIRYVEQYQHSRFHLPPLESSLLRK